MGGEPTCYLNTAQAATHLGLSPRTLEGYRVTGGGPPYLTYCNRIHYLPADLDAWALESRRRSTSDDGGRNNGRKTSDGAVRQAIPAGGRARLSVNELAALLGVTRRTLDRYRAKGTGPAFETVNGRVFYSRKGVAAWLTGGRRTSTSDAGEEAPEPAEGGRNKDGSGPAADGSGAEDA